MTPPQSASAFGETPVVGADGVRRVYASALPDAVAISDAFVEASDPRYLRRQGDRLYLDLANTEGAVYVEAGRWAAGPPGANYHRLAGVLTGPVPA